MWKLMTIVLMLSALFPCATLLAAGETEEYYYAIEQKGVISGYAHVVISHTEFDNRPCIQLIDSLWMQMSALGKSLEGKYRFEYRIDPTDGMYFYHTSDIDQGGTKMGGTMEVRGDSMFIMSDDTSAVFLPPGTVRESSRLYKHLVDFFVRDGLNQKECFVFSEKDGKVNTVTYFNRGKERLKLGEKTYYALAVESLDRTTGAKIRTWLDATTGLLLKTTHPFRDTYLSDASVRDKVGRANLNYYFMISTNKSISDPAAISYMKVRADLQPSGLWLTPEGLNVPGQKFEGTVQENHVDGVFEISHERYEGVNAPQFPCVFSHIDSLQKYLKPSQMIESDDSSLIREAEKITAGSKDAWEAASRLSRWVHEEIHPDIPGGGTALKTYQMRLGECGSHSNLLSAFCRAVGIPARGVFGCMYVPDQGGGFGQHAWNEIYMGKAGWIPVDCTAKEITYADCGHVRLGEWVSAGGTMFNPEKMEILEYRLVPGSVAGISGSEAVSRYDPYIGKYQGERGVLTIVVHEGNLGLDIPGRNMIYGLRDPDSSGNWYFKLSAAASVSFEQDSAGGIASMTINEHQTLPRVPDNDSAVTETIIPEEYRPFTGNYSIPMQNAILGIIYQDDQLSLRRPAGQIIALRRSELPGHWVGEKNPSTSVVLSFVTDETDQVTAMKLSTHTRCSKMAAEGSE
jgi:transglutaminase-like putative cysteine protease